MDGSQAAGATCAGLLRQLPAPFDVPAVAARLAAGAGGGSGAGSAPDPGEPLGVVLLQELTRANGLLRVMRASLGALAGALAGARALTRDLQALAACLVGGRVPPAWAAAAVHPSTLPLGGWLADLSSRLRHLATWADAGAPPAVLWLPAFARPGALLTALLQAHARRTGLPVDALELECLPTQAGSARALREPPPDGGAYVGGLVLEGAAWDTEGGCLVEPEPMQLSCAMPVVHLRPREAAPATPAPTAATAAALTGAPSGAAAAAAAGAQHPAAAAHAPPATYLCPLYQSPLRCADALGRPSFVAAFHLPAGALEPAAWVLRGVALLCAAPARGAAP